MKKRIKDDSDIMNKIRTIIGDFSELMESGEDIYNKTVNKLSKPPFQFYKRLQRDMAKLVYRLENVRDFSDLITEYQLYIKPYLETNFPKDVVSIQILTMFKTFNKDLIMAQANMKSKNRMLISNRLISQMEALALRVQDLLEDEINDLSEHDSDHYKHDGQVLKKPKNPRSGNSGGRNNRSDTLEENQVQDINS